MYYSVYFYSKVNFDFYECNITYTNLIWANNTFYNQPPNTIIYYSFITRGLSTIIMHVFLQAKCEFRST